jgi:hypothetical protein
LSQRDQERAKRTYRVGETAGRHRASFKKAVGKLEKFDSMVLQKTGRGTGKNPN